MNAQPTRKFLVVEDNEGDARLLREMFRDGGSRHTDVTRVSRMSEAEIHLAENTVDVILLDLGLPDADGLGAVRRAHAAAPHIPLVVLTGLDDESLATRALQEGAQDYLIKGQLESRGLMRALRYSVERKAMEEALFSEKERALVTLNSIGDAVLSTDAAGNVTFLNSVAEKMTGWSCSEAAQKPKAQVFQVVDPATRAASPRRERADGPERRARVRTSSILVRRDGREIPIEDSVSPILDRDGQPAGTVVVFRDVTERRQAESGMRKSEERFRKLFDTNTIGIAITELSGRTLEANDAYLDMLGYTREEVLDESFRWDVLTPPEFVERSRLAVEELRRTGVSQPWEKEYVRKDGTRVPVLIGAAMLEASEGTCIAYVVNLSARRQLEDQLRQAQKMEAVGQLAGGVAHDFNNLLTVILGHSDLLEAELTAPGSLRDSVDEIRNAGERAASLTRQLLAFSRRQVLEPKILDLNVLVENLKKMLLRMIGEDVELTTALQPALGCVRADAGQIEQILMNLALNARDAMPRGGKVTIETSDVELDGAYAIEHSDVVPGRYVMFAVSDTGTGMSPETRTHMFEPFFTTKGAGRGTGLGLATVYGIVKQSGGYLWVYSELGQGSVFKVYLPRVDAEVDAPLVRKPAVVAAQGTETLLLVEDERAVRALTRRILEARGYTVIEAADPHDALERARKHAGPIHLLLTDVVMPHMGGSDLAARLTVLRPDTRVIFMSGYTDDAIVRQGLLADRVRFLQKPFTPEGLARKVREALG